jgi:iron complex transport system substrate-binding protein
MFNPENGRPAFDLYREFSGWLGKRNRFDELERAYRDKLTMAREQLSKSEQKPVYAAILTNGRDGTLTILKEYGPLTTALDDLGFARAPIVATLNETEGRMTVGAELIGELDVDYIFTSYLPEQGQNSQSIYDDLDRIAPGYREFLKSYQNGHIVSLSRYEVYPPSFKGLDLVIDAMSGLFTLNDSP